MIGHKEERPLYAGTEVDRYPHNLLLITNGKETVGQITIKDDFEKNLWLEAIKKINETLQALNKS